MYILNTIISTIFQLSSKSRIFLLGLCKLYPYMKMMKKAKKDILVGALASAVYQQHLCLNLKTFFWSKIDGVLMYVKVISLENV